MLATHNKRYNLNYALSSISRMFHFNLLNSENIKLINDSINNAVTNDVHYNVFKVVGSAVNYVVYETLEKKTL